MDRSFNFFVGVILLMAAVFRIVGPPYCEADVVTLSDSTFNEADWELILITAGNGGTVIVNQELSGGNPGSFWKVVHTMNAGSTSNPSQLFGFYMRISDTYDPQVEGAIDSIDYTEDSILFEGLGDGQATGPALRQDGKIYTAFGLITPPSQFLNTWRNQVLTNLQQSDFIQVTGAGSLASEFVDETQHPDFSVSGSPIEFGFFRGNTNLGISNVQLHGGIDNWSVTIKRAITAIAGTSLDGSDMLQLDGSLSSHPNGDLLTFIWQIDGEITPRLGQIVSIADLAVGTYSVTLTVSDGVNISTDRMLFGVPSEAGQQTPTNNELQQDVVAIKDLIIEIPETCFDAPTAMAAENRRKALLNMLDKVFESIGIEDFQAAIDQLRDVLAKSDGLEPPESAPDWICDNDAHQVQVAQAVSDLIDNILLVCNGCN